MSELDPTESAVNWRKGAGSQTAPSGRVGEADDRLNGVEAIAVYLRCTTDGVYYARRVGSLPIRRLGRKGALYAFKTELDAAQKADSTLPEKWSGDCIGAS